MSMVFSHNVVAIVVFGFYSLTVLAVNNYTSAVNNMTSAVSSSVAVEQRLVRHLLRHYDTDARGVSNVSRTVRVEIELMLQRIQHLVDIFVIFSTLKDERSQVLTTTGHIICDWQDDRLRWVKEDFNNLEDVVIRPERVWLPELALMNGAELLTPDFSRMRVLVRHDGHVHWEPGGVFTTTCDIDVRYFPFDDQLCSIQFGAWAYYSARMNITNVSPNISTHDFRLNGEWEVLKTSAEWKENTLACCPNTRYPYVEFTLHLRRRQAFYVMNVIVPCALLSVLVLVVFCLPPDAGEKISLGISVVLAIIVFLLTVAETVPRTSLHVPVMVIYLTCTMALGTLSVCLTVMVLNLHHRDCERPVPHWARVLILKHLARILRISPRKPVLELISDLQIIEDSFSDQRRPASSASAYAASAVDGCAMLPSETIALTASSISSSHRPNADVIGVAHASVLESVQPETLLQYRSGSNPASTAHCRHRRRQQPKAYVIPVDHRQDWKELAHVLDRLYFWLMLIAMTISTSIIGLVPFYKK